MVAKVREILKHNERFSYEEASISRNETRKRVKNSIVLRTQRRS
jgi:hypothetical protein